MGRRTLNIRRDFHHNGQRFDPIDGAAPRHAATAAASPAERKPRLLVVDSAQETIAHTTHALSHVGIEVAGALTGQEGLAAARRSSYDMLLVDMGLPDMQPMSLVRQMRAEAKRIPFVFMSQQLRVKGVVEAMRLGALSVLAKPLDLTEVVALLSSTRQRTQYQLPKPSRAAEKEPSAHGRVYDGSPVARWAHFVFDTIGISQDPKTIGEWARALGVSRSVLAENCRLVRIAPREARDFARALRAVCRASERWEPELLLNCAEARTLNKLVKRGGLPESGAPTPSVPEFLRHQQWIQPDSAMLEAVLTLWTKHA